jgi:signal transduction histidine kinase
MLALILRLTVSEYGFIGVIVRPPNETPYFKSIVITNIAWNDETRLFHDENVASGLEFKNLDTLFGEVIRSEQPVIMNSLAQHPKSGGIPAGHPPLDAFMGLPIFVGPEMVGMIGVANRDGGYDEEWIGFLRPLLNACGVTISGVNEREARVQAEKDLRQVQRMEAMGQLTGGVAHDFNNLLSVMIGNTELLESQIPETPETRERIAKLKLSIDRAASLTQRSLAFSRQQPLMPESTDIVALFGEFEDLCARTLGEEIHLKFTTAGDLWRTMIDPAELDHALLNLAINARDAMPNGGTLGVHAQNITVKETHSSQYTDLRLGDYVEILVVDTGTGMAAATREKNI